jgi:hypothetical protein
MNRITRNLWIALTFGLGLTLALLVLVWVSSISILAAPNNGELFAATTGTGTGCTQGSPCSLPTALIQSMPGDTIYVAQGTYTSSEAAVVTITQDLYLYGGWNGAPTGAVARDPDAYPTILNGQGQRRVIYISGDITVTVSGFRIIRGDASLAPDPGKGGGIYSNDGTPFIISNVISGNKGSHQGSLIGYGGGLYLTNAPHTAVVSDNVFMNNVAATAYNGRGGAINCNTTALIEDNWIEGNRASVAWTGYGGGIEMGNSSDSAIVRSNTIISNLASQGLSPRFGWGGGMHLHYSSATVEDNTIAENRDGYTNTSQGGGLTLWYADGARIVGNLIHSNDSNNNGGGINIAYAYSGGVEIEGNRIISNTAIGRGGGIKLVGSQDVLLINNVVARNWTNTGAALEFGSLSGYDAEVTLKHNTIADNQGFSGIYAIDDTLLLMLNNIVCSHTIGITASNLASATLLADTNLYWNNGTDGFRGINAVDGDPRFVDPVGWDYHLSQGSAAIDTGRFAGVDTDFDGAARHSGSRPDIGADEFPYTVYLPLVLRNH